MMDDLTGGGSSERATGTPNTIYDLSSVLFHALEGGASYDTYVEDAEREGGGRYGSAGLRPGSGGGRHHLYSGRSSGWRLAKDGTL